MDVQLILNQNLTKFDTNPKPIKNKIIAKKFQLSRNKLKICQDL